MTKKKLPQVSEKETNVLSSYTKYTAPYVYKRIIYASAMKINDRPVLREECSNGFTSSQIGFHFLPYSFTKV